ncbi:MAG: winged helix-turn-helix domain-containing protein [Candidatus Bathyarchaeota archaeon]
MAEAYIRGMGGENTQKYTDARTRILEALAKGPLRYKELKQETGLSPSTLNKHLKRLTDEGLIKRTRDDQSEEYPKPVHYRLTQGGQKAQQAQAVAGLLRYEPLEEDLFPTGASLYSDYEFGSDLTGEEREELGEILMGMQQDYNAVRGILTGAYLRAMVRRSYPGPQKKLDEALERYTEFEALERRALRGGFVGSDEEDDAVRVEEEALLGKFGRRPIDLEADSGLYVELNRRMRRRPLRSEDYMHYLELGKSSGLFDSLREMLGLFEGRLPSLLLTFYSEQLGHVFEGGDDV